MACSWVNRDISRQLQDIKAHLCPTNIAQLSQKPSYAAGLPPSHCSAGVVSPIPIVDLPVPQPSNARQYDMTLKQKSHGRPEFANISNAELLSRWLGPFETQASGMKSGPEVTPDSEGNQGTE